jgi:hypothetical protein
MDRNSVIGIVLIGAIFILWFQLNKPSKEEIELAQRRNDSIANVEREAQLREQMLRDSTASMQTTTGTISSPTVIDTEAKRKNEFYSLENELIKLVVSTKGGRPYFSAAEGNTKHSIHCHLYFSTEIRQYSNSIITTTIKVSRQIIYSFRLLTRNQSKL